MRDDDALRAPADLTPIALGICITAAGILLLLHNLGMLDATEALRFWPMALVVVGASMVVSSLRGGRCSVPVGALFWIVILGLVLGRVVERRSSSNEVSSGDRIELFAVMSQSRRPPIEGEFSGGKMTAVMGGVNLDLRQAILAPGQVAVVDVFTCMGGAGIRVPASWDVDVEAVTVAGGVNNKVVRRDSATDSGTSSAAQSPRPKLVIRGTVLMGGLVIQP